MKHLLPDTINLHFTSACNAGCKFCFARYGGVPETGSLNRLKLIIKLISEVPSNNGARRVNFVGGEPTLHPALPELLAYAKELGLRTSIVTNGFELLMNGLDPYRNCTEMIGLSIDSIYSHVNAGSGRFHRKTGFIPLANQWQQLAAEIHRAGIELKINTVVHQLNHRENMSSFIARLAPQQWKIFQVTQVDGQNDADFDQWKISKAEFDAYCLRHYDLPNSGIRITPEASEVMINSYAMISPHGRFVDNSAGFHRYSPPIDQVGVSAAWSKIAFDQDAFENRRSSLLLSVEGVFCDKKA